MKIHTGFIFTLLILTSCGTGDKEEGSKQIPDLIAGTWQLLHGTVIDNGDTTVTDYTKNISFIKVINRTHFAFLQHDKNRGKDSTAVFVAGGGSYSLKDNLYTEHLEYCSAREWEGSDFTFNVTINQDTLTQSGIENVEAAGVNRINIEKYIRVKR